MSLWRARRRGSPSWNCNNAISYCETTEGLLHLPLSIEDKDQKLRPVQLWFVLLCNEARHYLRNEQVGAEMLNTKVKETLGSSFIKGKTDELRPALGHLKADETVGVAHWCDDGEAEIDAMPSADRDASLRAIDVIAGGHEIVFFQQ